jgi:hypothetical protein
MLNDSDGMSQAAVRGADGNRPMSNRRVTCSTVILCAAMAFVASGKPLTRNVNAIGSNGSKLENLVAVTEDRAAINGHGCDSISVFDTSTGDVLHRGDTYVSPGRLAASSDFRMFVAAYSNNGAADPGHPELGLPFVLTLLWNPGPPISWRTGQALGDDYARLGAAAITPNDQWLLVATNPDRVASLPPSTGYGLSKIRLSPGQIRTDRLGPPAQRLPLDGAAIDIFFSTDGAIAIVVTDSRLVYTVSVDTMTVVSGPVNLPPLVRPQLPRLRNTGQQQATITADRRYVISNLLNAPEIGVADLATGNSYVLDAGSQLKRTGGVAINQGWINSGLLAVHGHDVVAVYKFRADQGLELVGSIPIKPPTTHEGVESTWYGPHDSIAWSGKGAQIIAATNIGAAEFQVIDVRSDGKDLVPTFKLTACTDGENFPNDIVTLNGRIPPPETPTPPPSATYTPTTVPTDTPTPTNTPTAPATITPSATIVLSATPTPTPTSTRVPVPVYLPLLLREDCTPGTQRVDVTLVLDASSSMLELTAAGRPKLEAAVAAASTFLDQLHFDRGDQAAVVTFNSSATLLAPLSADRGALNAALGGITTAQFTRIDLGIAAARSALAASGRRGSNLPVMIVLTDGKANPVPAEVAVGEVSAAKADGVVVFTVGLGAELDTEALRSMATRPEYFYTAPDAEALAGIYRGIAVAIPCPVAGFWGRR